MSKHPYIGKSKISDSQVLFCERGYGIAINSRKSVYHDSWDESVFTSITAEHLRNTKIKIESPEHSDFVQNLVFGAGGEWVSPMDNKNLNYLEEPFLFIDEKLMLSYASSEEVRCFNESNEKEIFLPLPPKERAKKMPEDLAKILREKPKHFDCICANCNGRCCTGQCVDRKNNEGEEMKEKPIYTKEMHERGDLPPVGSEVLTSQGKAVIKLHPDISGLMIIDHDGHYLYAEKENIKPLPSPVDELESSLINFAETKSDGTWRCIAEAIINGDIDLSKYIECK